MGPNLHPDLLLEVCNSLLISGGHVAIEGSNGARVKQKLQKMTRLIFGSNQLNLFVNIDLIQMQSL